MLLDSLQSYKRFGLVENTNICKLYEVGAVIEKLKKACALE